MNCGVFLLAAPKENVTGTSPSHDLLLLHSAATGHQELSLIISCAGHSCLFIVVRREIRIAAIQPKRQCFWDSNLTSWYLFISLGHTEYSRATKALFCGLGVRNAKIRGKRPLERNRQ